jgi:hypothetical protein
MLWLRAVLGQERGTTNHRRGKEPPMSSQSIAPAPSGTTVFRPNTRQKVGLAIAGVYSFLNIPSVLFPAPEGEEGPPLSILAIGTILGIVGLVAVIRAWRGKQVALRIAAGSIIVITLTGLPAFFVDVPMAIKALVGFSVLLTLVSVVLMLSGDRRQTAVTD